MSPSHRVTPKEVHMELNLFNILLLVLGALDIATTPILFALWWGDHISP